MSPNINKKLPAVEMMPFFFRICWNHHFSRLTSSFVVMETRPSGRDAVEHPFVSGCISGAGLWDMWGGRAAGSALLSCGVTQNHLTLTGSGGDPRLLLLPMGEAGGRRHPQHPMQGDTPARDSPKPLWGRGSHHAHGAVSSPQPKFPVGIGLRKACPAVSLFISPV